MAPPRRRPVTRRYENWYRAAQIRDIVESAYDHGAEMIVTACPLCQANVEVYPSEINRKQGTKFAMPVLYYSQSLLRLHPLSPSMRKFMRVREYWRDGTSRIPPRWAISP